MRRRPRGRDSGLATVELAFVIPVLLAVAVLGAWLVSVATVHVRLTAAAADAAREVSRGAADATGVALVADRVQGATATIDRDGGVVVVSADVRVDPPGGWLDGLAGVELVATGRAVEERP